MITLYVVRELEQKRVWFAEVLLSSATVEVQQPLARARSWGKRLGKLVRLWISDKQDAFMRGIAAEFPEVPHRYCTNYLWRDVSKPVLEADSRAKVQMRRKVRGLRAIEREVLAERRTAEPTKLADASCPASAADAPLSDPVLSTPDPSEPEPPDVALDYCAAVRGILNDDQGGPLHPPGMRMAEALEDVHASLQRNLEAKTGGLLTSSWRGERAPLSGG